MSKRVYCVRHAKSDWGDPLMQDHDRPLNKRGLAAAPEMGKRLADFGASPDKIICSTAKRAHMTAELIAGEIGFDPAAIEVERSIYTGDDETYIGYLQRLPAAINEAMLVGHNPIMTLVVNKLANANIDNIVTCGIACIDFEIEDWQDLDAGKGTLVFYDFPKNASAP